MSTVGWIDPKGRLRELDDPLINLIMPQRIFHDMIYREEKDTRHSGANLTVTNANGCPRQLGIERMLDCYIEPEKKWPMLGGTYIHEKLGDLYADDPLWITEEEDDGRTTFTGMIGGRMIGAKLDLVSASFYDECESPAIDGQPFAIWDWKSSFNKAHAFAGKEKQGKQWVFTGKAKDGASAQMNLGRMLMEQKMGREFKREDIEMCAWVVSGKLVPTFAPHLNIQEIMNLKPSVQPGGFYTYGMMFDAVCEMYDKWQEAAEAYEGDIDMVPEKVRIEILKSMPLYGREMFKNRYGGCMCTDYCPYKWMCDEIEGGV